MITTEKVFFLKKGERLEDRCCNCDVVLSAKNIGLTAESDMCEPCEDWDKKIVDLVKSRECTY